MFSRALSWKTDFISSSGNWALVKGTSVNRRTSFHLRMESLSGIRRVRVAAAKGVRID